MHAGVYSIYLLLGLRPRAEPIVTFAAVGNDESVRPGSSLNVFVELRPRPRPRLDATTPHTRSDT